MRIYWMYTYISVLNHMNLKELNKGKIVMLDFIITPYYKI